MAINWTVANMAERDLTPVTSADVAQGAELVVQTTGAIFRAVKSGVGADCWAGVMWFTGDVEATWEAAGTTEIGGESSGTTTGVMTICGDVASLNLAFVAVADSGAPAAGLVTVEAPFRVGNFGATDGSGPVSGGSLAGDPVSGFCVASEGSTTILIGLTFATTAEHTVTVAARYLIGG